MKKLLAIYVLMIILTAPFYYYFHAYQNWDGPSTSTKIGKSLGGSVWWPAFWFSGYGRIDGSNIDAFGKTLVSVAESHTNGMYKAKEHLLSAIGYCVALNYGKIHNKSIENKINPFDFSSNMNDKSLDSTRKMTMENFDGAFYVQAISRGKKCYSDYIALKATPNFGSTGAGDTEGKISSSPIATSTENSVSATISAGENSAAKTQSQTITAANAADDFLKKAIRESEEESNRSWQLLLSDENQYILQCAKQSSSPRTKGGMQGDSTSADAIKDCKAEAKEIKTCMSKPGAKANICFQNSQNQGD